MQPKILPSHWLQGILVQRHISVGDRDKIFTQRHRIRGTTEYLEVRNDPQLPATILFQDVWKVTPCILGSPFLLVGFVQNLVRIERDFPPNPTGLDHNDGRS